LEKPGNEPPFVGHINKQTADSIYGFISILKHKHLGDNVILREVESGFIINIRDKNSKTWWTPYYIQERKDTLMVYHLRSEERSFIDSNNLFMHYNNAPLDKNEHEGVYSYQDWTLEEINTHIKEGIFSDTLHTLVRLKD
jgi:hypothetical protein